ERRLAGAVDALDRDQLPGGHRDRSRPYRRRRPAAHGPATRERTPRVQNTSNPRSSVRLSVGCTHTVRSTARLRLAVGFVAFCTLNRGVRAANGREIVTNLPGSSTATRIE